MSLTPGQLERRKDGLGGSDVSAILGVNPWATPLDIWMDKTGKAPPKNESEAMRWGTLLEPAIAKNFGRKNSLVLYEIDPEKTPIAHSDRPWHMGTPDRLSCAADVEVQMVERDGEWFAASIHHPWGSGLEIKTAGFRTASEWGETGSDQIPTQYIIQVSWYASLFGFDLWEVAALIGGQDYREYTIELNPRLEEAMLEQAERFWFKNVQTDIPPEPIRGDDRKAIGHLLKEHPKCYVEARGDAKSRALEAFALKQKAKDAGKAADLAVARLAESMVLTPGIEMDEGKAKWIHKKNCTPYVQLFPKK